MLLKLLLPKPTELAAYLFISLLLVTLLATPHILQQVPASTEFGSNLGEITDSLRSTLLSAIDAIKGANVLAVVLFMLVVSTSLYSLLSFTLGEARDLHDDLASDSHLAPKRRKAELVRDLSLHSLRIGALICFLGYIYFLLGIFLPWLIKTIEMAFEPTDAVTTIYMSVYWLMIAVLLYGIAILMRLATARIRVFS